MIPSFKKPSLGGNNSDNAYEFWLMSSVMRVLYYLTFGRYFFRLNSGDIYE